VAIGLNPRKSGGGGQIGKKVLRVGNPVDLKPVKGFGLKVIGKICINEKGRTNGYGRGAEGSKDLLKCVCQRSEKPSDKF